MRKRLSGFAALTLFLTATLTVAAAPAGEDPRPGRLIWTSGQDLTTQDAQVWNLFFENCIHGMYTESLVKDMGWNNYEPQLAVSWEGSPDYLTWTFKLRQGVTFSNGDPFTAADVVFSINRLKNKQAGDLRIFFEDLTEAIAVDDHTVRLSFAKSNPLVLYNLSFVRTYSHKQAEKDGDKFYEKFIGTGPWVFQEWKPGESITFARNPDWWGEFAVGAPQVVEHRTIPEEPTRMAALMSGEVDIVTRLSTDGMKQIESYPGLHILKRPASESFDLVMKNDTKPFNNTKMRQAIDYLTPRKQIVEELVGAGIPATAWSQPYLQWFPPELKDTVRPFDPEKAAALIAESGYNGEEIRLITRRNRAPSDVEICEFLAALWSGFGLNVTVEVLADAAYNQRRAAGTYEIFVAAWDLNSPLFHLDGKYRSHNVNRVQVDPVYAEKLAAASNEPDKDRFAEKIMDIERYLYNDPAALHLFYVENIWGLSDRVESYVTKGGDIQPSFERSLLAPKAR